VSEERRAELEAELRDLQVEQQQAEEHGDMVQHPESGILFNSRLYEVKTFKRTKSDVSPLWRYLVVVKGKVGYVRCLCCKSSCSQALFSMGPDYHNRSAKRHFKLYHPIEFARLCGGKKPTTGKCEAEAA
jgi:hypothetical protein